jgi:curved DNA-binding protein CbpA
VSYPTQARLQRAESAPLVRAAAPPYTARVSNHFATLELPVRPWLEPDQLQAAFHRLGAARHPDRAGGSAEAFAAVNAAWQTLRDPARRLHHVLELEGVTTPEGASPIPSALADAFMSLAALRRRLEDFGKRHAAATGTLARALLAVERAALERELRTALAGLEEDTARALEEVRTLDAAWPERDDATLLRLATVQPSLAFLGKWSDQLREALFQLGTS